MMNDRELLVTDIWRAVRARALVVIVATVLFGVLAGLAAYIMTPIYRATVLVAPAASQESGGSIGGLISQFSGLASLAGVSLGASGSSKDEAIAILASRSFTVDFIERNNLLPDLFPELWNKETGKWIAEDSVPDLSDGYHLFSAIRNISEDRQTGFVSLSIEWGDRKQAAAWANAQIVRVNEVMRANAIADAERGIEYLNRELEKTNVVELRQAIYSLIEGQINRIMLANVRDEYAFRMLDQAVVPDPEEYVRPRPVLMIAMGLLVGAIVGVAFALSMHVRRKDRA